MQRTNTGETEVMIVTQDGFLSADLPVVVKQTSDSQKLSLTIAETKTQRPVLYRSFVFRVPDPMDASLDWAVYYDTDPSSHLLVHLAVAANRHQCITWPPSTFQVWPVMFPARGDARKTASAAISSHVCQRPSGATFFTFSAAQTSYDCCNSGGCWSCRSWSHPS